MRRRKLFVSLFSIIIAILFSLFLDRVLGWVGFPDNSIQIAHPTNFSETRENIEFSYNFQTNSQGIRNDEIPIDKPENTQRITVVGDSFTEGWGVEANKTFTSILNNKFSTINHPTEFINCGLSGTAPLQYARILFQVCKNYKPDAVLIVIYPNDVTGTAIDAVPEQIDQVTVERTGLNRILYALWPHVVTIFDNISKRPNSSDTDLILETSEQARISGFSEDEIVRWVESLPPELVAATNRGEFNGYALTRGLLRPTHWTLSLDLDTPEAKLRFEAMLAIIEETIRRCHQEQIDVGIIILPSPFQHNPTYGDIWRQTGTEIRADWLTEPTAFEQQMATWAEDENIPYLDLTPHFRMTSQTTPDILLNYPLDGHWTPEGHQVAAEKIAEWLTTWYFQ